MDDKLAGLSELSDLDLIKLYQACQAGDPDIDRIADEMASRGIDFQYEA